MNINLIVPTNPYISRDTPVLWISACLLGEKVRYDGKHKLNRGVLALSKVFAHYSLCPEMEMGLGVPRAPISWFGDSLQENESKKDLTTLSSSTADSILAKIKKPNAVILKSKSPSCGIMSTLNQTNGKLQSGFFARAIQERYPEVKMAEENALVSSDQVYEFATALGASKSVLQDLQSAWNSLA